MRRAGLLVILGASVVALSSAAQAAPPTVTPSPGYDARLQEQRARSNMPVLESAPSVVKPSVPRRKKRVRR